MGQLFEVAELLILEDFPSALALALSYLLESVVVLRMSSLSYTMFPSRALPMISVLAVCKFKFT